MNYEEKINELESRLVKLENIEKRRKIKNIIVGCIYLVVIVTMIVTAVVFYNKLKPYMSQLENLKNIGSGLKSDTIIDGSNGFGDYDDFFNDFFNF